MGEMVKEDVIVQPKDEVLSLLEEHQSEIERLGVKQLGLFGSFLHGNPHQESDVDFLVEFQPGKKTFDNFMQLSFFLEKVFRRRVELVTPESLSPYIGPHILKEVLYVSFGR